MADTRILVVGIGAEGPAGLRPELIEGIHTADFLAGGERHLRWFPKARGERLVLKNNLADLSSRIQSRHPHERCVVLASGDPLFYGIGTCLVGAFGPANVRIEPALSSMQLAFARAGLSWQAATLASIHGRDVRCTLLPLLGQPLIGLFTQDGNGPADAARFFLERGLSTYEAFVGENLGAPEEHVSRCENLEQLAGQKFAPLNYLILRRTGDAAGVAEVGRNRALAPGIPDEAFDRPADAREIMTRQEVRCVTLGKLLGPAEPGDVLWDVGAGLGTVAVEAAVLRPNLEVVAVERERGRCAFLRRNRERFGAYNIRVVEGVAPAVLENEELPPRMIFVGGTGGELEGVLDLGRRRLRPGGRLLANFVTLEHLMVFLARLREWNWPFEATQVQAARSDGLAGLTGLKPQRAVFLVGADKPEAAGE